MQKTGRFVLVLFLLVALVLLLAAYVLARFFGFSAAAL